MDAGADIARIFSANRAEGVIALAVATRAGATRRVRVREEGPLRLRCPGPPAEELEAVVVNTAGGIAGGDRHVLDITVAPAAHLVVTTASAEKVYRRIDADAEIDVRLAVGAGGSLAWLPQETILFDRAGLRRKIAIDLAADARLLLAEALVLGRTGMGEAVEEGRLLDRWHLRCEGRLVHVEAVRLDGAVAAALRRPAVANGAVAMATVLVVPGEEATVAAVRARADTFRGEVGASAWNGMALVRLCARDGAALRHDLASVLEVIRGTDLPRLWMN